MAQAGYVLLEERHEAPKVTARDSGGGRAGGQPMKAMVSAMGSVLCLCEDSQNHQDPAVVIILSPDCTDIFQNDAKCRDCHTVGIQ